MKNTEQRIAKVARRMAKIAIQMRQAGDTDGAARIVQAGIETCEAMRKAARS